MDPQEVTGLAKKVWARYKLAEPTKRILIGIAGIPGAGKTTLARRVVDELKAIQLAEDGTADGEFVTDIPMDGYHLTRAQLAAMPDPEMAIHRRGAAFTFDGEGFLALLQKLSLPVEEDSGAQGTVTIYAPSFDHAVKDPVADSIPISPKTRIVIIEGNYLALDREPWKSAASLLDEIWFANVDREVARERLAKRHVEAGIVPDEEAARERIRTTDFLNADDIEQNLLPVSERVRCG
ncbi:hypothetical protein ACKVWC_000270 [Pyricularia oryzae]|uniref:Phosphoribulokinase/uridine kinase family protein n=2 Tax=Pyricularia oryzae TaxID=318829 RepID=A0AA97PA94_PYRO3|nr:phosphoribulokinase/uridine kinase family protein [Pyricularia oryzae Y34]KAI7912925.1 phosphoribulokinase/uridine kinase family protein [Pyricularia oryzae]KAI7913880.1 phosphoribulokinase/uridine kinase family protein [Pyricularia oryzae]